MTTPRILAKPTAYRGVGMRSKLETQAAACLDALRIPWVYEPKIFSEYRRAGTGYLPDFRLWPSDTGVTWYLEIKPNSIWDPTTSPGSGTALVEALDKMTVIQHRANDPHAVILLWICDPRSPDLGYLLERPPFADRWTAYAALSRLRALAVDKLVDRIPNVVPWWRQLLGRFRRTTGT